MLYIDQNLNLSSMNEIGQNVHQHCLQVNFNATVEGSGRSGQTTKGFSGTFGPHLEQKMLMKCQLQRGNESSGLSGQIRPTSPVPAKLSEVSFPTYLVKTPAAKPKVVSLALSRTSASVSNGKMDITGPKISSFTQVMSSLQLAANIVTEPDISDGLPCLALENAFSAVTMKHTTLRTPENSAQNTSCSPARGLQMTPHGSTKMTSLHQEVVGLDVQSTKSTLVTRMSHSTLGTSALS